MAGPDELAQYATNPAPPPSAINAPAELAQYASKAQPSGVVLSNPSTVPNARIRNLPNPAANEPDPLTALYHGAKTGAQLASIPAAATLSVSDLLFGTAGAAVGGYAAQKGAKTLGAGELGQEMAGDAGSLLGGALSAKVGSLAISKGRAIYDALPADIQNALRKKAVGLASPRLKNAMDLWDTLGSLRGRVTGGGELDATGEFPPYAGEKTPTPEPWNAHDATGENKPFAGGMDEWRPKPGANPVSDPLWPLRSAPTPEQLQAAQPSAPKAKPKVSLTNDPILNKLRLIAAKIEADEAAAPKGSAGPADPDADDLTPELLQSLAEVTARKRASAPAQ